MRHICAVAALFCSLTSGAFAQLTTDQKVADFMQLAGLYAKNYAPYEWKRDVIGFDLYNVQPWLDQVKASTSDMQFYDICVRYVASLQDSHDEFTLPSDFEAWAHLSADLYDGKLLIDGIDRSYLPARKYPFVVGDEIVSIDGKTPQDLMTALAPYAVNGSANPVSRQRLAVSLALDRVQSWWPGAVPTADSMTLVVHQQATAQTASYSIPWDLFGTPFVQEGPVPSPKARAESDSTVNHKRPPSRSPTGRRGFPNELGRVENPWGIYIGPPMPPDSDVVPSYVQPLKQLQTMEALDAGGSIEPFGTIAPVFNPPPGFKLRLGAKQSDMFLSGTFPAGDKTAGYIRVPTMSPASTNTALQQFQTEIAYFQQNTDGLVIDVMRNGGGSLCYAESLMTYLMPTPFRSIAYQIRATQFWVEAFSSALETATLTGAPQWVLDLYSTYLKEVQQAMTENRGLTGDVPICSPNFTNVQPAMDARGNYIGYTKPILLLTDNFTLSAAEAFAALLQDPGRVTVFGTRTDGGGGNPASYTATTYSEGATRVTRTFVTRARPVQTPGFPASLYIENQGVYPDIVADYMTQDNLMNGGKSFIAAFTAAISGKIANGR